MALKDVRNKVLNSLADVQNKVSKHDVLFQQYQNPDGIGQQVANVGIGIANNLISKPMQGGHDLAQVYKTALTQPMNHEEQYAQYKNLIDSTTGIGTGVLTALGAGQPVATAGLAGVAGGLDTAIGGGNFGENVIKAIPNAMVGAGLGAAFNAGVDRLGYLGKAGREFQVAYDKKIPFSKTMYLSNKGQVTPEKYIAGTRAYWRKLR